MPGKSTVNIREQFRSAAFEVEDVSKAPEKIEVRKNNCTRLLERQPDGTWTAASPPFFKVRGLDCELEDQGYQKFWLHKDKRFPVRLADLKTLHRFDQELRAILGLKSLYHESLGTTSARSVYDRLSGRPNR